MGWGRMFFLGNIGQQMDIEEMKEYLNRAIDEINEGDRVDADQNRSIEQLRKQNKELQLYVLALVRVLVRKNVLNESELAQLVTAVEGAEKQSGKFPGR